MGATTDEQQPIDLLQPPPRDSILFACWCAAVFGLSLTCTLVIVHRAASSPTHHLPGHYLATWAATAAGSFLVVALLGGLVVFRRQTPWGVVLLWPLFGGPVVALGFFVGLSGQMEAGSALCKAPAGSSCDTSWGFGALAVGVVAAAALWAVFTTGFVLKKLGTSALRPPS